MNLYLKRFLWTDKSTIGHLFIENDYFCFTLEDHDRQVDGQKVSEWKKKHETCVPRGTYEIVKRWSSKYRRIMPFLVGVEGFDGVMIHVGNFPEDTSGCLLVGSNAPYKDFISGSKVTYIKLEKIIYDALEKEKVYITITNA